MAASAQRSRYALAGILAFAVAIWASTVTAEFTFDDRLTIVEHEGESALPVALFAAWLALRRRGASSRAATGATIAVAVLAAASLFVFRLVSGLPVRLSGSQFKFANPLHLASTPQRLHGALQSLGHYVEHLFAPVDLCPDYGYAALVPHRTPTLATWVGAAAVLVFTALLLRWRKLPVLADAVIGLGATYVVMSNVLIPASAFVADRVFFFPSFWVIAIVAIGLDRVVPDRTRKLVAVGAGAILALQALVAGLGARVWHDNHRLGSWGVRACPGGMILRQIRAVTAEQQGENDEAAWALLVAGDIQRRFPEPIPRESLPGDWEDLPVAQRLAAFREARSEAERREACAGAWAIGVGEGFQPQTMGLLARYCR